MTLWQRIWTYQQERFPLAKTVPLLAVFSAASISVSALLAGRPLPGAMAYVVGFTLALILFFQMRAADEWKDHELDQKYRPERPIPRGLVSLRSVLLVAVALIPLGLAAAFGIGLGVVGLLCLVWAWLAAMTLEFGAPHWLTARPLIYLVSHMLIMPLIDLLLTGIEWTGHGGPAPALWLFLALSFMNGCVLEVGRKIWATEREGVETYSGLWGPQRSVQVWLGLVLIAAGLLISVGIAVATFWPIFVVAVLGLGATTAIALGFMRNPTEAAQKRVDAMAGIWVLLCYGAAGFLPLWLGGAA